MRDKGIILHCLQEKWSNAECGRSVHYAQALKRRHRRYLHRCYFGDQRSCWLPLLVVHMQIQEQAY
eukprot:XP_001709536.1 Hypothetical protein GL50803_35243 [Giardia lamblia ATCC 50803]